jgi:probable rRNA maturation factor
MNSIRFQYADRKLALAKKKTIQDFVASLFKKEKTKLDQVQYVFCSDAYLLNINRNFLAHDYYTDIITFGLSEKGEPVTAEVYISTDRVKENATQLGIPFKEEMLRVIFHGALHLCGYKDKKKTEIAQMRERENHYLGAFAKLK